MASVQAIEGPRGKRYKVHYRDPGGKQRKQTFLRAVDARNFAHAIESDKLRGDFIDPILGRRTVGYWADAWAGTLTQSNKTQGTYLAALRTWVLPYFEVTSLADVTEEMVAKFVSWMLNPAKQEARGWHAIKPPTAAKAVQVLGLVLEHAKKARAIRDNPARSASVGGSGPQEMHFTDQDGIRSLAEAIGPRWSPLVIFDGFTGLRAGECCGLRVGRLDLGARRVEVREVLSEPSSGKLEWRPTKDYETRTVRFPSFLVPLLAPLVEGKQNEDVVFAGAEGGLLRHSNFYERTFKPAVAAAAATGGSKVPPGFRFHDLRHSYASMLIAEGAHPKAIMQRLGHSNITVTLNRYGHLFPELEAELTAALERRWVA